MATLLAYARSAKEPPIVRQEAFIALRFTLGTSQPAGKARPKPSAKVIEALVEAAESTDRTLAHTALHTLGSLDLPEGMAQRLREARRCIPIRSASASSSSCSGARRGRTPSRCSSTSSARWSAGAPRWPRSSSTARRPPRPSWPRRCSRRRTSIAPGSSATCSARSPRRSRPPCGSSCSRRRWSGWGTASAGGRRSSTSSATPTRRRSPPRFARSPPSSDGRGASTRRSPSSASSAAPTAPPTTIATASRRWSSRTARATRARRTARATRRCACSARSSGADTTSPRRSGTIARLSLDEIYYVGFHFAEEGHPLGEELLSVVVKKGGRAKVARMAKNKLSLSTGA